MDDILGIAAVLNRVGRPWAATGAAAVWLHAHAGGYYAESRADPDEFEAIVLEQDLEMFARMLRSVGYDAARLDGAAGARLERSNGKRATLSTVSRLDGAAVDVLLGVPVLRAAAEGFRFLERARRREPVGAAP